MPSRAEGSGVVTEIRSKRVRDRKLVAIGTVLIVTAALAAFLIPTPLAGTAGFENLGDTALAHARSRANVNNTGDEPGNKTASKRDSVVDSAHPRFLTGRMLGMRGEPIANWSLAMNSYIDGSFAPIDSQESSTDDDGRFVIAAPPDRERFVAVFNIYNCPAVRLDVSLTSEHPTSRVETDEKTKESAFDLGEIVSDTTVGIRGVVLGAQPDDVRLELIETPVPSDREPFRFVASIDAGLNSFSIPGALAGEWELNGLNTRTGASLSIPVNASRASALFLRADFAPAVKKDNLEVSIRTSSHALGAIYFQESAVSLRSGGIELPLIEQDGWGLVFDTREAREPNATLTIRDPRFLDARAEIPLSARDNYLELTGNSSIRLRLDGVGDANSGRRVAGLFVPQGGGSRWVSNFSAEIEKEGAAVFLNIKNLFAGDYRFYLHLDDFEPIVTATISAETARVVSSSVQLRRGTTIRGTVVLDSSTARRAGNKLIYCKKKDPNTDYWQSEEPFDEVMASELRDFAFFERNDFLRDDGTFEIKGLPPGEFELIGMLDNFEFARETVEIRPGESEVPIIFAPKLATVSGRILGSSNASVSWYSVSLLQRREDANNVESEYYSTRTATLFRNASFAFANVPFGKYKLTLQPRPSLIRGQNFSASSKNEFVMLGEFEVRERSTNVEFSAPALECGNIAIRVSDHGAGVRGAGVHIAIFGEDERGFGAETGSDGFIQVNGIPAGKYCVYCMRKDSNIGFSQVIDIGSSQNVELTFGEHVGVRDVYLIDGVTKRPIACVYVDIRYPGGEFTYVAEPGGKLRLRIPSGSYSLSAVVGDDDKEVEEPTSRTIQGTLVVNDDTAVYKIELR
jgi:hypothetical protein